MNEKELLQAFIQWLAEKTGAKSQKELEAVIKKMGKEGLAQAQQQFMQELQAQQAQVARFGAKLDYIKKLRGVCPEGYDVEYYKKGGTLCKKCKKKEAEQGKGDAVDQFKKERKGRFEPKKVEKERCGGKSKFKKAGCGCKMK